MVAVLGASEMPRTVADLLLARKGKRKGSRIDLSPRDAKRLAGYGSEAKWVYDSPDVLGLLHDGLVRLDERDMVETFLEWIEEECYVNLINNETGESLEVLSPKRGNPAYARNKRKKASEIYQGLKKLDWDYPVPRARNLVRDTHLLLITLTFDQKATTKEEAWRLLTARGKAFNRFSANMSRTLGTKATLKVKEATKSGYPAPHILVMLDRPVRAFRYKKKWRMQSEKVLDRLRRAWPYGFIDVRAVISSRVGKYGVVYYMMKYLTKTIGVNCRNSDSSDSVQWEEERAAVLTHVWNKVFRCRDVLSKAFKERLNAVRPSRPRTGPKERVWFFFSIDRRISPLRIGPPSITGFYPTKFRPDLSLDQFS
jgi:hypothetical protein